MVTKGDEGLPGGPWWQRTCLPGQEMQEAWVWSLGWEDPLEEEKWKPTPVSLPEKFYGQKEPSGLQSMGSQSQTWLSKHMHARARVHIHTHTHRRQKRGRENREFGINRYTLPCMKQINNQDLLCSTRNYIQYLVITYNKKESEKMYVAESLCCILEPL